MTTINVPIQIRFADVDMAGHVHNAVHLHWFETARMVLQERFIPADHDWREQGLILARNEVDYRMPIRLNDRIEVHARCGTIGNKSFDILYSIHRMGGDVPGICAEGRSVLVCFNYIQNRSVPLPGPWRLALEQLINE